MRKDLPCFLIDIKEDDFDESGVDFVALVDRPAIERDFIAFNKTKQLFVTNEEQRIVSGPLMIADLQIYRNSKAEGEHYVVFNRKSIFKIVQKYFRKGFISNVNLMHDPTSEQDGIYIIESFIIDSEKGINTPKGHDKLTDGSWFASFKVDNDNVWNRIKDGTYKAFSVEGLFEKYEYKEPVVTELEKVLAQDFNK